MNLKESRYSQLIDIVEAKQPSNILEIGVGQGRMAEAMLAASPKSRYWGFDLFDLATEETDRAEMNVKPPKTKKEVRERLGDYEVFLFRGNTRETLKNFVMSQRPNMDVVFIDGGHSVETIRSDWEMVKNILAEDAVVIFDDYYVPEMAGFGCNKIIEEIEDAVVLPKEDWKVGGGAVRMVRV